MMDKAETEGLIQYEFIAAFRRYKEEDAGSWNFLFMPKELAKEIRANFKWREEGWGRMKVTAEIGSSKWKTSIWFDTKHDTYFGHVRKKLKYGILIIKTGDKNGNSRSKMSNMRWSSSV